MTSDTTNCRLAVTTITDRARRAAGVGNRGDDWALVRVRITRSPEIIKFR